jgi:K+-transporting ATPase KdpF subunit
VLRPDLDHGRRLRAVPGGVAMILLLSLVLAVVLAGYLLYALLRPEEF